jgi:competence protein ComEA
MGCAEKPRDGRKTLNKHYDTFIAGVKKKGLRGSVNINRAKLAELVALPRIGPVLAIKIIAYREAHHSFTSIDEIKKIDGIGTGTFNAIRYYISVK